MQSSEITSVMLEVTWQWRNSKRIKKKSKNSIHIPENTCQIYCSPDQWKREKKPGITIQESERERGANTSELPGSGRTKTKTKPFLYLTGIHGRRLGISLYFWRSCHKQIWKEFYELSDPKMSVKVESYWCLFKKKLSQKVEERIRWIWQRGGNSSVHIHLDDQKI